MSVLVPSVGGGGVVEGDGVALGAGHGLLVVAAAPRGCFSVLQRLAVHCCLLLTSLVDKKDDEEIFMS